MRAVLWFLAGVGFTVGALFACCNGGGRAGADGGDCPPVVQVEASPVVAYFTRADADGSGALEWTEDGEWQTSGGADMGNLAGRACPAGWTYLGYREDGAVLTVCTR